MAHMSDGEAARTEADRGLVRLNALPQEQARQQLLACCGAPEWAEALLRGRPYADANALLARAAAASSALSWPQVRAALRAHPAIGTKAAGADREAAWSRREQAASATANAAQRSELAELNEAYLRRFGHVFLICAAGRDAADILAALRTRLAAPPEVERETVRDELGKIARLRLARLLEK